MPFTSASLARLDGVHPVTKTRALHLDEQLPDLNLQITQGRRNWDEQDALWAKGRTTPGIPCTHDGILRPVGSCPEHPLGLVVTNAKGGYSGHNFAYPIDVVPEEIAPGQPDWNLSHPAWKRILETAPSCGFAEGATWRTFPDAPHLYPHELPADPTDAMRAQYALGGIPEVWRNFPPMANI
jgi:peptidoglycan LD-endopeptidase CwlK